MPTMGRTKTINKTLPPRMFARRGKTVTTYYYIPSTGTRKKINLGHDLNQAKIKWAQLEAEVAPGADIFATVAERYVKEVLPGKAPRTQKDNLVELNFLLKVFGKMPIGAIKPKHVKEYIRLRSQTAKVRANREKALLSHVFNFARESGITDQPNPCAGVKGNRESGRDHYVDDEAFMAVWKVAHYTIQDAMDLAYLTGQRPADILKMKRTDIHDGALWIQQNKTKHKMGIAITGELEMVIKRILGRKRTITSVYLIQDDSGQPLNQWTFRSRFDAAREKAGVEFQFRDIRAKAATDMDDLARAQKLLGHSSRTMTEHYTKKRKGEKVEPLK